VSNSDKPLVSIIMPCYNAEKFLAQSIESALGQTYKPLEVILVNDGSTDRSMEIAKRYGEKIKILSNEKSLGPASARNKGLSFAKGDYIQFLDSDDLLREDKIEKQAEFLKANPDCDVVFSEVRDFTDDIENCRPEPWREHKERENYLEALLIVCIMAPHSPLIRKTCLDKAGWFLPGPEFFAIEDWELWVRLCLKGAKFMFLPGILAFYRRHGGSISSKSVIAHRYREEILFSKLVEYITDLEDQRKDRYCHILSFGLARQAIFWAELKKIERAEKMFCLSDNIRPEIIEDIQGVSSRENGSHLSTLYLQLSVKLRPFSEQLADRLREISDSYYKTLKLSLDIQEAGARSDALFRESLLYYRKGYKNISEEKFEEAEKFKKIALNDNNAKGFWRSYALLLKEKNMLESSPGVIPKAIEEAPDSWNCALFLDEINKLDEYPDILTRAIRDYPDGRRLFFIRGRRSLKKGHVYSALKDFFECFNKTLIRH